MDNITIRKMRQDDIEQCINIEKSHNIKILSREILENDLKKDSNYYLVATLNNTLIGYIGLSYVLDTADIISIVVKKDYTKKGIASLLLSEIISLETGNKISKSGLYHRFNKIKKIAQKLKEKKF